MPRVMSDRIDVELVQDRYAVATCIHRHTGRYVTTTLATTGGDR